MLKSEAAAYLAGVTQTEGAEASAPTNLHVITGEVGEASADGKTLVKIDGLMFSESDDQFIEVDALGGLEEGDIATIVLTGEQGHAMTPLALGSIGSVDRITVRIAAIEADYIKVEQLDAAEARIGELEADHVSVDDLDAATARIGTLETTRATITDLEAATARIGDLEADHVSTDDLNAATARIGTLETNTADIGTIRANSAKVQNLTAAELEADHAAIEALDSNYAHITNGVIDNATIGYADVNNLSAHYAEIQNGKINSALIDTAAIVDEQVFTVTGNKATLAQIDASKINVLNLKAKDIEVERINGQPVTNKTLVDALSQHESDISDLDSKIDDEVEALNDRIDGAIETFTGTVVPTLENTPASQWNTVKLKDQHVGDVYYVVNSQSAQNGYCYRFTKSGSTYSWQLIKDSDVTAALSRLQTAEGKITSIEQFDVTVGSFMTDTDDEISSLKTRATTLETSMGDKVDTSTFNTVSQKVDENSASISTLSENVSTKADSSTVTTLSNTVNTVKQTADTNKTSITNLTKTVSDNKTAIETRASTIEQNLSGITTRVSATETNIANETALRKAGYATSTTAIGTAAKVATITPAVTDFSLYSGCTITVRFDKGNTAANPTLNVNGTGAKKIVVNGTENPAADLVTWSAYQICIFTYDGTYWRFAGSDGETVRLKSAETAIEQNAEAITLRATKAETTVGGRNLLSGDAAMVHKWTNSMPSAVTVTGEEYEALYHMIKGIGGWENVYSPAIHVETGKTYTVSMDYSVESDYTPYGPSDQRMFGLEVCTKSGSTSNDFSSLLAKIPFGVNAKDRTRGSATFTATTDTIYLHLDGGYIKDGMENKDFVVSRLKLEEGSASTAYMPPYSDYATAAELKVANDNINLKVSKNDVINQINVSTEGAKIDADKVEINGTAIFSAISSDVDDAITSKGYQTSSQVNSAITSKGYATTTQAQGYASTAKSEAISAAATDATTKANAAETNAKAYTDALEIGGRNLLRNSLEMKLGTSSWENGVWRVAGNADMTKSHVEISDGPLGQCGGLQLVGTQTTTTDTSCYGIDSMPRDVGGDYVISMFARVVGGGVARAGFAIHSATYADGNDDGRWATYYTKTLDTTGKWTRIWKHWKSTATTGNVYIGGAATDTSDKTIQMCFVQIERGSKPTDWTPAPEEMVRRTQRIWYRTNASGAPSTPGTASSNWVTKADDGNDAWTKMHISISSTHKYIYTCEQYEMANGTVGYTSVLLDNTITVIDGGNIITGTVTANKLNAADINASKSLTIGAFQQSTQDAISNDKVPQYKVFTTTYSYTLSQWLTYASEGAQDSWSQVKPVNVGDTVLIKGTNKDTGDPVYLLVTVDTVDSSSQITKATSHGLIDPTAGQRADSILVGGRNLLLAEPSNYKQTSYDAYTIPSSTSATELGAGTTLTIQFWDVALDANSSGIGGYWGGGSSGQLFLVKPDADGYCSKTFTIPATTASHEQGANKFLALYNLYGGHSGMSLSIGRWKLEKGNKPTDWTPAPEDMATAESLAGTNESLEGAITDIGELSDQLVGTISEQNKTITDIQKYLNSLRQDLDAEIQSRQQWLNFNAAEGLVIGAKNSTFKTVTTNTSQQFRSGGTVLAETSGTEFVAPIMRSDQLLIGNWMWTRRDNGNLSLKWIG